MEVVETNDDHLNSNLPWIEKYRPIDFDSIVGNDEVINRLKIFAENGNMPNILLSGPPGTGKTTTILCYARAMLGDQMKNAILELNASNERGIDVVREKIKMFAQTKINLPPQKHKLIILDEADSMTTGAQQALRRTMEIYSQTTRFALACNTSEKIIEPIQSRCAVIRYGKLKDNYIKERIIKICKLEKVNYTEDGIQAILFTAQGDMRQAINNLQSTFNGFSIVNNETVFKVCDEPHPLLIEKILKNCLEDNYDKAFESINHLWKLGYSSEDIIENFFHVVKNFEMAEYLKLEYIKEIGLSHLKISKGINSLLQFTGLLARLCKKKHEKLNSF